MFYKTMTEHIQDLKDNVTRTLKSAEEYYEGEFRFAIRQIESAHCDLVCFDIREAMVWDGMVLSAITSARNAENNWKEARKLYDEVMEHYK